VATQYAFAGYSALTPLLVGAIFWRKSTRWGALASALWVAAAVLGVAAIQQLIPPPAPGLAVPVWTVFGTEIITRSSAGTMVLGMLPVVPMTLISGALMAAVSLMTPSARPSPLTLTRYFTTARQQPAAAAD